VTEGPLTIGEVLRRSTDHLEPRSGRRARLDAERLLGHGLGMERVDLYMHLDRPLSPKELAAAHALVARRAIGEPLQYVLGEWGFRRLALRVDSRALIPRPETETVVERCLALLDGDGAPRVLDVGTGTGAIALAIAVEHPGARVTAIDVSQDALALAGENAGARGSGRRHHDLFAGLPGGVDRRLQPSVRGRGRLASLAPDVVGGGRRRAPRSWDADALVRRPSCFGRRRPRAQAHEHARPTSRRSSTAGFRRLRDATSPATASSRADGHDPGTT
jgi:release factor glutamine methyltransferase